MARWRPEIFLASGFVGAALLVLDFGKDRISAPLERALTKTAVKSPPQSSPELPKVDTSARLSQKIFISNEKFNFLCKLTSNV